MHVRTPQINVAEIKSYTQMLQKTPFDHYKNIKDWSYNRRKGMSPSNKLNINLMYTIEKLLR